MIPIYEQRGGRGIGHGLDSFYHRFDEICRTHETEGRAKAFAFIFYDFTDSDMRKILKDQGVFARLDRLSGRELSIFYLHTGSARAVKSFNATFLERLGIAKEVLLPCVAFFRLGKNGLTDVAVASLESTDLIHGFSELYGAVEQYLSGKESQGKYLRWFKSGTKWVATEGLKEAIKKAIGF